MKNIRDLKDLKGKASPPTPLQRARGVE